MGEGGGMEGAKEYHFSPLAKMQTSHIKNAGQTTGCN